MLVLVIVLLCSSCTLASTIPRLELSIERYDHAETQLMSIRDKVEGIEGGFMSDVLAIIRVDGKTDGWGLESVVALPKHSILIDLPLSLTITMDDTIPRYFKEALQIDGISHDDVMSYYVAVRIKSARNINELPLGIQILPPTCIDGSDLFPYFQKKWPQGTFESRFHKINRDPHTFQILDVKFGGLVTFEDYRYAYCLLRTRSFMVNKNSESCAMVPIFDLLNHKREGHNAYYWQDESGFHLKTVAAVKAGEELRIRYFDTCWSPLRAMALFGFWEPNDKACMSVDLYGGQLTYTTKRKYPLWWESDQPSGSTSISGYYKRLIEIMERHVEKYKRGQVLHGNSSPMHDYYFTFSMQFLEFGVKTAKKYLIAIDEIRADEK